jgi:citrate lyase subunit beta/citryl-CoA lyase
MRSKLFVPGSRPELFAKAAASAADALSFDLEDAVAPGRKAEARQEVAGFLARRLPGKRVVVRVNPLETTLFAEDIAALMVPGVDIINLPKVEDAADIHAAAAAFARLEGRGRAPIGILANIETPRGLRKAADIALADPRVMGLQIGYADLFEPAGIDRLEDAALAHVRVAVRLAAAEAGIAAYDGAYAGVARPEVYQAEAEAARRLGFAGKSCIHPSQIALANAVFQPAEQELAWARRVLAAAGKAAEQGVGAFMVDGAMVDEPFILRARALLAVEEALGAPA